MEGTPFGRYQLIELLGRGGMGEVWRAFDTATNRVVALKVLPANLASDPQFEQRFRREAFAAAGLTDPHVVPIHNFGEIDGRLYVDMRLIKGRDLQSILAHGPIWPARAVSIIDQVASALHEAHQIGLVHRDVKPSNILIAENDFAYLIDFGIARAAGETKLTGTGNVIGTLAYLAPERLTSGQTDPRSDIYALACVLHECLTGSQPFPGDSIEQQIAGHLALPPPRPSAIKDTVPTAMDAVIARGMAKNPDERYPTVNDMTKAARAAVTMPIPRPQMMMPTEPVHHVQHPPSLPTRPSADPQASPYGGVSPIAPTQYRPPSEPNLWASPPQGPSQPAPKKSRRGLVIALTSIAAVIVIVAVVVGVFLASGGDGGSPSAADRNSKGTAPPNSNSTAVLNSGPFTGVFSADYGDGTYLDGKSPGNQPAQKEEFALRSDCPSSGCVATASVLNSSISVGKKLIFDDIGGKWVAVMTGPNKCGHPNIDGWQVISLQSRPDGTLSGESRWTDSQGCNIKRPVTFTRTRDVTTADGVADPSGLSARVKSPAQGLWGRYHYTGTYANGGVENINLTGLTDCLRDGARCMSFFYGEAAFALEFANGSWTELVTFDKACPTGGTTHSTISAQLPLPQPLQDPITLLTGHGRQETSGSACTGGEFDLKFDRTGD